MMTASPYGSWKKNLTQGGHMAQKHVSVVRCDAECNVKYTNLSADPSLDIPLPLGWSTINGKDFCPTHSND